MNNDEQVVPQEDQYKEDGFVVNDPIDETEKRQKNEDPSIEVSAHNILYTKRTRKPVERYEPSDDEMLDDFTDENEGDMEEGDVDEGDMDEGDMDEGDKDEDTDSSYKDEVGESTDHEEEEEEEEADD